MCTTTISFPRVARSSCQYGPCIKMMGSSKTRRSSTPTVISTTQNLQMSMQLPPIMRTEVGPQSRRAYSLLGSLLMMMHRSLRLRIRSTYVSRHTLGGAQHVAHSGQIDMGFQDVRGPNRASRCRWLHLLNPGQPTSFQGQGRASQSETYGDCAERAGSSIGILEAVRMTSLQTMSGKHVAAIRPCRMSRVTHFFSPTIRSSK